MPNLTRNQLAAAAAILVIAFLGVGFAVAKSGILSSPAGEIQFIQSDDAPTTELASASQESEPPRTFCVHIAGKVAKPGVYELDPGSRVQDAIEAAGGAADGADLESINLAEKITDGMQIRIVPKGEIPPPRVSVVRGGSGSSAPKPTSTSRSEGGTEDPGPQKLRTPGEGTVNINTAGLDELQRLPGVGPATAQKIIDYRTEHGRFQAVEQLDEVSGIGPAKLRDMRPFVSL